MAYNPSILDTILRERALTHAQLSERLKISPDVLERQLERTPEPKQGILSAIARELALPPFVFYLKEAPQLADVIPDFRSVTRNPVARSRETIKSIQWAERIQATLRETGNVPLTLPIFREAADVDSFALEARRFFEITESDQAEAVDAKAFYLVVRKKIEDKGILVLQDSFPPDDGSGFCLWNPFHPIIVVNTKQQTRTRRLFTLAHELAHILMHQSGISDAFRGTSRIERRCNDFASNFLLPASYVRSLLADENIPRRPSTEDIARLARKLKVSHEATVLQLERIGLIEGGSHSKWVSSVRLLGNPDFKKERGGGKTPPPQEKVKLAKYGFEFARLFNPLLTKGKISEIELFRASGLKPKFGRQYFDYVRKLSPLDVRNLELGDE